MPACCIAVASMFTWTDGLRPARRSCSNRGGMTTTNIRLPRSISVWASAEPISRGNLKRGGKNALNSSFDSGDPSSSTNAIEALLTSLEVPVACV